MSSPCRMQKIRPVNFCRACGTAPTRSALLKQTVSGRRRIGQEGGQLGDLARLGARFAREHGQRQLAQLLGVVADAEPRRQLDHAGTIEPPREHARHGPPEAGPEIEIDVDPAEKHGTRALVVLVEAQRRVGRQERDLRALFLERSRPGVVMHARSAKHPRPAGGHDRDMHRQADLSMATDFLKDRGRIRRDSRLAARI